MAKKIIPSEFKTHLINQLLESVDEPANSVYYSFIGNHLAEGSTEEDVEQPLNSVRVLKTEAYRNMILAKRLTASDMRPMIKRHNWIQNTVYAMYDDQDINLLDKNFFAVVDEGAYFHVWKCLYNNNDGPSTVKPLIADIDPADSYVRYPADSYQWKYMFSVTSTVFNKFATEKYIPVVANTYWESNAIDGSIDMIKVDNAGKLYQNHLTGTIGSEDVLPIENKIRLSANASTITDFYKNTIMHIMNGSSSGEYRFITSSEFDQVENRVVATISGSEVGIATNAFTDPFGTGADQTSQYEISPAVVITGNGTETSKAYARAIINPNASNSVSEILMLNVGENYSYAEAKVLKGIYSDTGPVVETIDAEIRPILSPSGGHGANSQVELASNYLCIYNKFERDELGTVVATNTFGQFGIIRDPLFTNVIIDYNTIFNPAPGSDGTFIIGEKIYQFDKIQLQSNATVSTTSPNVTGATGADYSNLKTGDWIYLTDSDTNESNFISQISAVTSSTVLGLSSNVSFSSANTKVYKVDIIGEGTILTNESSGSRSSLGNVDQLSLNKIIIGANSYAVANVTSIDINNRQTSSYDFNAVNPMTTCFSGSAGVTGVFVEDEKVFQGNENDPTATAYVHSYDENNEILYLTNVTGTLTAGASIETYGSGSGATFNFPFDKYNGDFDATSGDIIYIQNDVPVSRIENQSEIIRVILEF